MEFDFDKFVVDIEKRSVENTEKRSHNKVDIYLDQDRRLRSRRYHERWQNCTKWERR